MKRRRASCACGRVQIECAGEPVRVSVCHCLECQRRTGSAFGAQARFPAERVTVHGAPRTFERVGDSGGRISFCFCSDCGTTTHWQIDRQPDLIAIALGAFADPAFPAPTVSVYDARRHPWVSLSNIEVLE